MAYMSKENCLRIRSVIRERFPNCKISVVNKDYSTVSISILEAPVYFGEKLYQQVNVHWIEENFRDLVEAKKMLLDIYEIANGGNHDNSDSQSDYFDVGFYVDINIGKWDKPFICNKK